MKYGLITFLETGLNKETGQIDHETRLNHALEEIVLADQLGFDYYGIGEHHRADYAATAPEIILSHAAALTKNIHLGSAVTVLSSDDPIRVYEKYATLSLLSNGRVEVMAGRGSFIESFGLFGLNLKDYNQLYEEKLHILLEAIKHEHVTYDAKLRPPLKGQGVYPRAKQPLKVSIAVGGTPESVVRAAKLGLPIVFAIIGGNPLNFKGLVDLYKKVYLEHGHHEEDMEISVALHAMLSLNPDQLIEDYYPSHHAQFNQIGRERGWSAYTKEWYLSNIRHGAFYVGHPEHIADRLIELIDHLGIQRLLLQIPGSLMPHDETLEAIRLYANVVKPKIEAHLKR